jgi:hypothetical protein
MPFFALLSGDEPRVHQVEPGAGEKQADEPFPVGEPLRWVKCPKGTTEFHTWNGEGFDAPPAPVRVVRGYLLVKALTDEQHGKLKPRDQGRLSGRGSEFFSEDSDFIERTAGVIGITPKKWFDAALAVL